MNFAENLAMLCQRAGDKAELVVRRTALDLMTDMIDASPVDTGRFKANFVVSTGIMTNSTVDRVDRTPKGQHDAAGAVSYGEAILKGWKPGQTIWILNNLSYAQRLEYGWSKQAPGGMVRLAVQNYSQAIKKAADQVRGK